MRCNGSRLIRMTSDEDYYYDMEQLRMSVRIANCEKGLKWD